MKINNHYSAADFNAARKAYDDFASSVVFSIDAEVGNVRGIKFDVMDFEDVGDSGKSFVAKPINGDGWYAIQEMYSDGHYYYDRSEKFATKEGALKVAETYDKRIDILV